MSRFGNLRRKGKSLSNSQKENKRKGTTSPVPSFDSISIKFTTQHNCISFSDKLSQPFFPKAMQVETVE